MTPLVSSGQIRQVGEHSYCVESLPEAASNAGIIVGAEAVAVVDSRLTPSLGKELRQCVVDLATQPSRQLFLVNSHFHGDHWFGNSGFPDATVIASEWTRTTLAKAWREQVRVFAELRPQQAAEFGRVQPALPSLGVTAGLQVDLGEGTMALQCAPPAHTPGDLVVWSIDQDVIYAGDLVVNGHWPVLWDADVTGWLRCLDDLRKRDVRTVVPGHGPAGGPELIDTMTSCLRLLQQLADSPDENRQELVAASPFRDWLHPDRVEAAVTSIRSPAGTSIH